MSKPNSALQVLVAAMGIVVPAMAEAPAPADARQPPPTEAQQPAPVGATQDIEPTRPISLVADLRACAAQPAASRSHCLTEAANNLKHGLDYQECLWGTVPSAQCQRALPQRAPSESEAELLKEGRKLVTDMEAAATDPAAQLDLTARLEDLLPKAAAKIRETRGAYTLVSQGGVSLGSWQAGYIYYLTELLKNRRVSKQEPAFRTLTGASAGAVNALAAGIEGCRSTATGPKDSLFYKVWVESLGMFQKSGPELFPRDEPTAVSKECTPYVTSMANARLGLFDSAPLCQAMSYANEALRQAPNDSCAFNVGFSVTHLHGVKEAVYQNGNAKIDATKLTEYFALNVRPRPKQSPLVTNLPALPGEQSLTAQLEQQCSAAGGAGKDNVCPTLFLNAVRASGAFPVAFPPVPLSYRSFDGKAFQPHTEQFVDGGTLDNAPISLAASMNEWTRQTPPNPWFSDLFPKPETYVLVNPNLISWELAGKKSANSSKANQDMLSTYFDFALEFAATGTDAQLVTAKRQLDFLRNGQSSKLRADLLVPLRNLPIAGAEFGHFMAFLEKDFRNFDFFVGMADAAKHLGATPELGATSEQLAKALAAVPEFACLREYYADATLNPTDPKAPRKDVAPDQLPAICGSSLGNFRKMLAAMHNYRNWQECGYNSAKAFDTFFDKLSDADFTFSDLTKRFSPDLINQNPRYAFRVLMQEAVERLAAKQDGILKPLAVRTAGRLAGDSALVRTYPRWYALGLGLTVQGGEVTQGLTLLAYPAAALRLSARERFSRIGTKDITESERHWGMIPSGFLGLTGVFGVPWVVPGSVDVEVSAGAAYQTLWIPNAPDEQFVSHSVGASVGLDLVALQRLYLHGDATALDSPFGFTARPNSYDDTYIETRHDKALTWSISGGMRFFMR